MNNLQINEILKNDKFTKKIFYGALAIDKLPKKVRYPSCLIINNQSSEKQGEHWLAIFFNKKKEAIFFDSFGLSPVNYNLDTFLIKFSKKYTFDNKKIQSFFSTYCGYYCILFLLLISRGKTLKYFQNQFQNVFKNDNMIKKFIKKYI